MLTLSSRPSLEQSEQMEEQAGHSNEPSWSHSPSEADFSRRTGIYIKKRPRFNSPSEADFTRRTGIYSN